MMKWRLSKNINDFGSTNLLDLKKSIELGYLIFYDTKGNLKILDRDSLEEKYSNLQAGSHYFNIKNNNLYFNFTNSIEFFNIVNGSFQQFCTTQEERIQWLNSEYCIGTTSKRKPRTFRKEIISTKTNEVVYKWADDKDINYYSKDLKIFHTRFKGDIFSIDTDSDYKIWDRSLDNGIAGKRFILPTKDGNLIFQRKRTDDTHDILKLNSSTGEIIWEFKNSFSSYQYDDASRKLVGINGNKFHTIDELSGNILIESEWNENIFVFPHLITLDESLIYFWGYNNKNIPLLGISSATDGKLISLHEMDNEHNIKSKVNYNRPVVFNNFIYLQDSSTSRLLIYELTKVIPS